MKTIFHFPFSIFHSKTKSNAGFTLIELIIVFAIISIMAILGIAAFVDYNRSQILNSTALDLAATINLAKSRAQSQVKPDTCTGTLDGYKIGLCKVNALDCSGNDSNKDYALYFVCGGNISANSVIAKTLPSSISFDSTTTTTSILFRVLTGGVSGSGSIVLSGYNKIKTVTIDSSGNIDIN